MENGTRNDAPSPNDQEGWRHLVASGSLQSVPQERIVAAIQQIHLNGDRALVNSLVAHISDVMMRLLRRIVYRTHANEGNDIIERTHGMLIEALLKPDSTDGRGLREAFGARVRFRAVDVIRSEMNYTDRFVSSDDDHNVAEIEEEFCDGDSIELRVSTDRLLEKIPDLRRRFAFRLYMDGVPLAGSKGAITVSRALGISGKTAKAWIKECQALLRRE